MKVWGFPTLQLGSIEVIPTEAGDQLQQKMAVCSCCDYCCPQMRLADCGHFYCERCVVELSASEDETIALCTICRRIVDTMEVYIQERFIAQLQCSCPLCDVVVRVMDLRDHITICITENDTATSSSGTKSSGGLEKDSAAQKPVHPMKSSEKDRKDDAAVGNSMSDSISKICRSDSKLNLFENRLNALEEMVRNLTLPLFPAYFTVRLTYAYDLADFGEVFRSPMVYLGGVGFHFAADSQSTNLSLWVSFRESGPRIQRHPSAWKATVWYGTVTDGPGNSVLIRDLSVGESVNFVSFFEGYARKDVVLTVCIDGEHL